MCFDFTRIKSVDFFYTRYPLTKSGISGHTSRNILTTCMSKIEMKCNMKGISVLSYQCNAGGIGLLKFSITSQCNLQHSLK